MDTDIKGWILDEFIAPGASLKQGDLIKFENEESLLKKVGIVVTADCDLENKKHAKLVTLVPVVPIQTLMEHYLLPEDCEKKKEQIADYAFRAFDIDRNQELELKNTILIRLIDSPPANCEKLSIIAAQIAADQLDSIKIEEYKALMIKSGASIKKAKDLEKQVTSRGDLLPLPDPSKLGVIGNIAWVRHIWQVPLATIALRTSEVGFKSGERIARLDSPYRYRLTQLMAQVFSDIGVPNIQHSIEQNIQAAYDHV
ncbi:hypothetical protein [Pollutimonas sp. M17]|uniref:hypothetical protein n=1 Tax=Pollutimonas sp. M17 TaxID=2962065 RepID=UPI0021F3FE8D|nr:hypothetical protein [Pollutimonas sp. M17]UYO95368.1 hypothetical protein OEG81_08765 [Pollutimonas sp. M17]